MQYALKSVRTACKH